MNDLFSVRNVTWTNYEDGFNILVTTDVPCHLWLRHTLEKPLIHAKGSTRRGLTLMKDVRFCFTQYIDNQQAEAGDTLTHTFIKRGWPFCVTWFFYFWGYVNKVISKSTSPLFELHNNYGVDPDPPVPPLNNMYIYPYVTNPAPGRLYITLLNQAKDWATIYQTDDRGSHWTKILDNADFGGATHLPWMLVETYAGYLCLVWHQILPHEYFVVWQADTLAGPWVKVLGTTQKGAIWRGLPYLEVAPNLNDVWCSGLTGDAYDHDVVRRSANGGLTWCACFKRGWDVFPCMIKVNLAQTRAIVGATGHTAIFQNSRSSNPRSCYGTWDSITIAWRSKRFGYVSPYVVLAHNWSHAYSTDNGLNFVSKDLPLAMRIGGAEHWDTGLDLSDINPARVLCSPAHTGLGVWVSYDWGDNWVKTLADLGHPVSPYLQGVLWDRHDPSVCYAWGSLGFFRSNDAGQTWTERNSGFLDLP